MNNNTGCSVTPPASKEQDYEVDTEGSCARLLPLMACQKCKAKNTTLLELKQELTEEKNKLRCNEKDRGTSKCQQEKKTGFPFKESKIVKDLKKFTQVCKIMEYLCDFIIESIKRQRNCSISGEIHLLR